MKSYKVEYPNGKTAVVSEAVAEIYKEREGHKILHEVDRKTGEPIKKVRGGGVTSDAGAAG